MPLSFDVSEAQEVVRALAAVASADGAILDREESFLEGFSIQHNIGAHVWLGSPLDEVSLARAVTDPTKRRRVVELCLTMAHTDHDYAPEERAVIERIAAALSITPDQLQALTATVAGSLHKK
jgi:tellurite resistance protein